MRFIYWLSMAMSLSACTTTTTYYLISNDPAVIDTVLKKQPTNTTAVSETACSKVYLFVPSLDTRTPEELTQSLLEKHPISNAMINWHYHLDVFWVFFYSSFCTTVEMTPVKI